MAKKRGLGKGLEDLFTDNKVVQSNTQSSSDEISTDGKIMLSISQIDTNKKQPRKRFDEEKLNELAESIREHGIIEPLIVKKTTKGRYQIIAGERRWRAARIANIKEVPVVIGDYSDREIVEVALIENLQREDLNPIEEALAYKQLIDEHDLRQEEVAQRVSKGRSTITNSMRLLELDQRVQDLLIEGALSSGHARALLAIKDGEQQFDAANKIIENGLSVREVEKLIRDLENADKKITARKKEIKTQAEYKDYEKKLVTLTGLKVEVRQKDDNKGKIVIPYNSVEEFEKFYELVSKGSKQ